VESPVYLDNNASTRLDKQALEAMIPWLEGRWGNASSRHAMGMEASAALQTARRSVRRLVGAEMDSEIVFTSGGTEAANMALLSALENRPGRNEIVYTAVEHPAILATIDHLARARGIVAHRVGVDSLGRIDLPAMRNAVGPRTAAVCCMWANNETGNIHPVRTAAAMAHAEGALMVSDAVQAAGRIDIDVASTGVDFLSISAHKFHGPKGAGALYAKHGLRVVPCLHGGKQERGRRAGTENVPALVGMAVAAESVAKQLPWQRDSQSALRDLLRKLLSERIADVRELGDPSSRLPNTLLVAFEEMEGEDAVDLLSREGVLVSSGSACASGSHEPSHVLRAMKVPFSHIRGAIRFSLSRETTEAQVRLAADALERVASRLRTKLQVA
jgi:cysteine desulfurase